MIRGIVASILLCFLVTTPSWAAEASNAASSGSKRGFDRVDETGVLRCGYFMYPPFIVKDLNTGKFSGIYPDIFAEIAKQAGLKIEWTEEVGSDTMFEGLKTGRYDAICAPLTYTIARAKQAYFTKPFIFVPFNVYVRANETRFDKNPKNVLNAGTVTFAAKDGDLTEILAKETFPNVKILSMPGLTDAATLFSTVATKKADAIIGEPVYAGIFMRNNPNMLKPLAALGPVQVIPGTGAVPFGDHEFLEFLNTSIQSLLDTGFIKKTVRQYVDNADDLLFPAPAYQVIQ